MAYEKIKAGEVGRPQSDRKYSPSAAPKWDVLQRERLKGVDLDLDYRVSPVLPRKDRHYVILIIGLIGFLSLFLTIVNNVTSYYLVTPFIFALFTTISILQGTLKFITQRVKWIALVSALAGPFLWLVGAIPRLVHYQPIFGYIFLLVSLSLSAYLAARIGNHYAKWLAASPQLLGNSRYQVVWKHDGFKLVFIYGVLLIAFCREPIVGFKSIRLPTIFNML